MAERKKLFSLELSQVHSQAAARGMLNSSVWINQIQQAHERELEVRAIIAWESLVRVHRIFGQPMINSLRNNLKGEIHRRIDQLMIELTTSLDDRTHRSGVNISASLLDAHRAVTEKHDIEVDLYVDSLSIKDEEKTNGAVMQHYNFYGAVGSVQTGANVTANVIQNLDPDDRASLSSAIQQVRDVLSNVSTLGVQERRELLEIVDECMLQMSTSTPNNTKLFTMFNVLGIAIQSIASAQPAYQALKAAVLTLGITLP